MQLLLKLDCAVARHKKLFHSKLIKPKLLRNVSLLLLPSYDSIWQSFCLHNSQPKSSDKRRLCDYLLLKQPFIFSHISTGAWLCALLVEQKRWWRIIEVRIGFWLAYNWSQLAVVWMTPGSLIWFWWSGKAGKRRKFQTGKLHKSRQNCRMLLSVAVYRCLSLPFNKILFALVSRCFCWSLLPRFTWRTPKSENIFFIVLVPTIA